MKHVKLFESWNANESENGLEEFKTYLINYCADNKDSADISKRALELLDEISTDSEFNKWLTQGKTLLLQDLLRKTTYKGNGNAPEHLVDFNAFSAIDSAGMHFREAKESLTESVIFDVEFNDEFDGQAPREEARIQDWKFSPTPAITVTQIEGSIGSESNDISLKLSNGHEVSLESRYSISPNPSDSKKNFATLKINGKEIDVKDEYMGFIEDFGSPLIAVLKCYEKHYSK